MEASAVTAPLAFVAGALSFLSPCVLPLVPVYLTYLSGSSLEDGGQENRWHTFSHALFFVGGFTVVFAFLFGLPTTLAGKALIQYNDIIARVGGFLIIIFALHTLGLISIPFLNMTKQLQVGHGMAPGYFRSFVVGVVFAAGWTPCIGPLLGAVMSMAFDQPSRGIFYTLMYAAGLAVPFLVTALMLARAAAALRRMNRHAHIVARVSGVFLLFVGALLVFNQFSTLNSLFIEWTPSWMLEHL